MRTVPDTGDGAQKPRHVSVAIPGIKGISIVYDSTDPQASPRMIFGAVVILEHWLTQSGATFQANHVRIALRRLHVAQRLAATELAHIVYGNIPIDLVRGNALHALLLDGLDQLGADSTTSSATQRSHLILQQLYVECVSRFHVAEELGISERQFQRELQNALNKLTGILQRSV